MMISTKDLARFLGVGGLFGLGLIFAFSAQIFAFHALGMRDYGRFSVLYSICAIGSMIGVVGFDVSSLRFFSTLEAEDKARFYSIALRAVTVCSLIVGVLFVVLGGVWLQAPLVVVGTAAAGCLLWSFVRLYGSLLRADGFFVRSTLIDRPLRDGALVVVCGLASVYAVTLPLGLVIGLVALAGLAAVAVSIPVYRHYGLPLSTTYDGAQRQWIVASLSLLLAGTLQLTINRIDVIAMSAVSGPESAAILNVMATISDVVVIPSSALLIFVMPAIARSYENRDWKRLASTLLMFTIGTLLGGLVTAAPIFFRPSFFLDLFGAEAIQHVDTDLLNILLASKIGLLLLSSAVPVLLMSGRVRSLIVTFIVIIGAKVVAYFALVPSGGIEVAVYIVTVGAIALGIVQSILCYRLVFGDFRTRSD